MQSRSEVLVALVGTPSVRSNWTHPSIALLDDCR